MPRNAPLLMPAGAGDREPHSAANGKTLHDMIRLFGDEGEIYPDVSLVSFLISHGFPHTRMSVGLIGAVSRPEVLALNAILPVDATLVALAGDTPAYRRGHISKIAQEIEVSGALQHLHFADLTLPSRWPRILSAMSSTDVGIIGIDASWAATCPDFWTVLQTFMGTGHVLVYIRGMLDYRRAGSSIPFLRSMPADCPLSVVAATPRSLWFAANEERGAALRELLRSSGLFAQEEGAVPTAALDAHELHITDGCGHLPRVLIATTKDDETVDYAGGWSQAEADGCWTDGGDAIMLRVPLPTLCRPVSAVAVTGNAWIPPNARDQLVHVGVGNEPQAWAEMSFVDSEKIMTAILDVDGAHDMSSLVLRVRVQSPGRPSDFGGSDTRMLGFKLRKVAVFT